MFCQSSPRMPRAMVGERNGGLGRGLNFLYAMLRLFGALPDRVNSSRPDGRSCKSPAEFVPGKLEKSFLIGALRVWERTGLKVEGNGLICLAHRVRTEVGNAPLHDGLVFFRGSCLAIVGGEFRKIRTGDDYRKAAVRVEHQLALRIGTPIIALLSIPLKCT